MDCPRFGTIAYTNNAPERNVSALEMLAAARFSESAIGPNALILSPAEIASSQVKMWAIGVATSSADIDAITLVRGLNLDVKFILATKLDGF